MDPGVVHSVADLAWVRPEMAGPDGVVTSATVGGPGLIAVGRGDDEDAMAWLSEDGISWQRAEVEDGAGPGTQWMTSVTPGGPGFVAVGTEIVGDMGDPWEAAVWVSEDGGIWERVIDDSFAVDDAQEMWGVIQTGSGLVAVGFAYDAASDQSDMAVWLSEDGYGWARTSEQSLESPGHQGVSDFSWDRSVAVGSAGLVAVGDDEGAPAAWVSEDGVEWEQVDDPELSRIGVDSLASVIATESGYMAIGTRPRPGDIYVDVAVWTSPDGRSWSVADSPVFEMEGGQLGIALINYGEAVVAIGYDLDPQVDLIWYSNDGLEWNQVQDPALLGSLSVPTFALAHGERISVLSSGGAPVLTAYPPE